MFGIRCLRRGIPRKTQENWMAVRNEEGKKVDSKIHAGPVYPVNKNPTLPRPPQHRQTLLLLRRHSPLLHHHVVHVGRLSIQSTQEAKNPLTVVNLNQTALSLLRSPVHALALNSSSRHQAIEHCAITCNFLY